MKWVTALVAVVGTLALAAGIVFYTVPAHSLPVDSLPLCSVSHVANCVSKTAHRTRLGEAAIVFGVVVWVIAIVLIVVNARNARRVLT